MHFSKLLQGSKLVIPMNTASIESTLLLFLLLRNFRASTMREKCPYSELFLSASSRIWTGYSVSLCIQSECGKMWTRITPKTDTFYTVPIIAMWYQRDVPLIKINRENDTKYLQKWSWKIYVTAALCYNYSSYSAMLICRFFKFISASPKN